jgi:hypothetical protein
MTALNRPIFTATIQSGDYHNYRMVVVTKVMERVNGIFSLKLFLILLIYISNR